MLLQSGLHEIESLGLELDILVRAKKAGLILYEKAGFILVDQLVQDASEFGIDEAYGQAPKPLHGYEDEDRMMEKA